MSQKTSTVEMRRMSNREVAARIGLTYTAVSRIRSGQRIPLLGTMLTISKEFNLSTDDLMNAAQAAQHGDTSPWVKLLEDAFVTEA